MNDIERKALALLNEVFREGGVHEQRPDGYVDRNKHAYDEALCRTIEQHEAFKQEVSDAVNVSLRLTQGFEGTDAFKAKVILERLITKPDPLVEAMAECGVDPFESWADQLRAALAKRGLEIREKSE